MSIDPKEFQSIYTLLKTQGVVNSRRGFARKAGVSSTLIDDWLNEPNQIDSKMSTLEKITRFVLPHVKKAWRTDDDEVIEMLLGDDAPLRRDLRQALRLE